ncbi:MAG: hypothetical protein ACYC6Y_12275 [Thermoguttaceae bacterium]
MKRYEVRYLSHMHRRFLVVLTMCSLASLLGCGSGSAGPERYDLSGNVTFEGKPIPAGQIVFEPDAATGNSGAQGYAEIRDGKYDTRSGKGVIGGPHQVRITGLDRFSEDESDPPKQLFPEYQTKVDLAKGASTQDFEVPGDAGAAAETP